MALWTRVDVEKLQERNKDLEEQICNLRRDLNNNYILRKDLIECEKCSNVIFKSKAIKGKAIIKQRVKYYDHTFTPYDEDYIYYPHYCKKCNSKKEKKSDK